jgi:glycosyltransferase involved in cell wall biosynthesis
MKNGMKSLIKNTFGRPYFEIMEADDELRFHLKKAVPFAKHFLVVGNKRRGEAIVKEIIKSEASLRIEEIESLGQLGKSSIFIKIRTGGKEFKVSAPFVEQNKEKYLMDKNKSMHAEIIKKNDSTLGIELIDNVDALLSKFRRGEIENDEYKAFLNEKLNEIDDSSINLTKVYGTDISEILYRKPKDGNYPYKLSSIVLVYNGEEYLRPCLDSLVNQTLDGLEIILINDKSTDCSLNICKEYASRHENIRIIDKQDNHGLATSANMGIQIAKGEYVILVDNDDIIPKDAYEKLYAKAKEHDADISVGKANFIVGTWQQEMKDFERTVWNEEKTFHASEYTKIFCEAFYWNKIMRKEFLMDNDIYLPVETKVYADRKFVHEAFCRANKISMIPDCVYLWRRVTETDQESLSMRRKEAWNYIDRIDSYEMNLDFYTDFDKNYFKKLMRRVIYPIEGIINNEEFENVFFERGVSLLKRECPKVDDLYENDMTVLENLYLYLSLNDLRDEIKEVIINNDDYRDLVDIDGKTYWNMPLFRNEELKIPDEIFEVKSLMSNFIDIEQLSSDGEYIRFKNVRLPKYLDVESAEIFFMERIGVDEVLDENFKSYKLVESDERNVFNLNIPIEDLNLFQIHDAYLQANYKSKSTNKVRIKEKCIGAIENGNDKLNIYATKNQRNIAISSSLYDKFRFELVSDDLGMTMINRSEGNLKREMPIFIKDLKTGGFVKFLFDKNLSEDNIKWTELDGKGNYGFYLSTFKNGRIKMGVPMKKSNLIDFKDMEIGNIRLYEDNKGNIRFDIL